MCGEGEAPSEPWFPKGTNEDGSHGGSPSRTTFPMISIIIPCWNDAAALKEALERISTLAGEHEIIVADASTTDDSAAVARSFAARVVHCDHPNRGRQMNAG